MTPAYIHLREALISARERFKAMVDARSIQPAATYGAWAYTQACEGVNEADAFLADTANEEG